MEANESYLTTPSTAATNMTNMTLSPARVVKEPKQRPKMFAFFRKTKKSSRKKLSTTNTFSPKKATTTTTVRTTSMILPKAKKQPTTPNAAAVVVATSSSKEASLLLLRPPSSLLASRRRDVLFSNTLLFLEELEKVCVDIEKTLLRSFSQKITGWALQPWSKSKKTALAQVTHVMRERLAQCQTLPVNPIDSELMLVSLDTQGCYILPSAHFPLLLTFDCQEEEEEEVQEEDDPQISPKEKEKKGSSIFGPEKLYRTKVELVELRVGASLRDRGGVTGRTYIAHGSVAGTVVESGRRYVMRLIWETCCFLCFPIVLIICCFCGIALFAALGQTELRLAMFGTRGMYYPSKVGHRGEHPTLFHYACPKPWSMMTEMIKLSRQMAKASCNIREK
jgi:hypothetical protein